MFVQYNEKYMHINNKTQKDVSNFNLLNNFLNKF